MKEEWKKKITDILTEIYPDTKVYNFNSSLVSAQLRNRFYWTNIPDITPPQDKKILLQSILESGYTNREKSRAILESDSRPLVSQDKMLHRYKKFTTIIFKDNETYLRVKEATIKGYTDIKDGDLRYFTQTELERLQTLPEKYTKCLTRNKAAGVIGDGWTVDVIAHILSFIK